jgi:hypothetical protein
MLSASSLVRSPSFDRVLVAVNREVCAVEGQLWARLTVVGGLVSVLCPLGTSAVRVSAVCDNDLTIDLVVRLADLLGTLDSGGPLDEIDVYTPPDRYDADLPWPPTAGWRPIAALGHDEFAGLEAELGRCLREALDRVADAASGLDRQDQPVTSAVDGACDDAVDDVLMGPVGSLTLPGDSLLIIPGCLVFAVSFFELAYDELILEVCGRWTCLRAGDVEVLSLTGADSALYTPWDDPDSDSG